jgi:2-polyprenyl-3-methyl-5-hydroxy-6-metoxy-1,4-benzoquinol methylase
MIYLNKEKVITKFSSADSVVLDIGFWGQGKGLDEKDAPHTILSKLNKKVYGIDLVSEIEDERHSVQSAEDFHFDFKFDSIWALDLIEHLSNQGLFLEQVKKHLNNGGKLIITTPNCFCLFNLTEKITKYEPTTNKEHTCYYNHKTLRQLLERHGFKVVESSYVYSLEYKHKESLKKKFLNIINYFLTFFTDKFSETILVVAEVR